MPGRSRPTAVMAISGMGGSCSSVRPNLLQELDGLSVRFRAGGGKGRDSAGVAGVRIRAPLDEESQQVGAGAAPDRDVQRDLARIAADVVRIHALIEEPPRAPQTAARERAAEGCVTAVMFGPGRSG